MNQQVKKQFKRKTTPWLRLGWKADPTLLLSRDQRAGGLVEYLRHFLAQARPFQRRHSEFGDEINLNQLLVELRRPVSSARSSRRRMRRAMKSVTCSRD